MATDLEKGEASTQTAEEQLRMEPSSIRKSKTSLGTENAPKALVKQEWLRETLLKYVGTKSKKEPPRGRNKSTSGDSRQPIRRRRGSLGSIIFPILNPEYKLEGVRPDLGSHHFPHLQHIQLHPAPSKVLSRKKSIDSLLGPELQQAERQVQRQKIISYLEKEIGNSDPGFQTKLGTLSRRKGYSTA